MIDMRAIDTNITTTRTQLRSLNMSDEAVFTSLYSDADIMKFIANPLSESRATHFFRSSLKENQQSLPKAFTWAIRYENSVIGFTGITWPSPRSVDVDAGIVLPIEMSGRGLATEVFAGLIQFCFDNIQLASVSCNVHKDNIGSIRFLEKLNFQFPDDRKSEQMTRCSVFNENQLVSKVSQI